MEATLFCDALGIVARHGLMDIKCLHVLFAFLFSERDEKNRQNAKNILRKTLDLFVLKFKTGTQIKEKQNLQMNISFDVQKNCT